MGSVSIRVFIFAFLSQAVVALAAAEELAGSEWQPTRIGTSLTLQETKMFIQFKGDGNFGGHGGCNRISGQYKTVGNKLTIGPIASTRMACDVGVMNLETKFLLALEKVKIFDRNKFKLILSDEEGNLLAEFLQTDRD
ncbi:MAG: META domain-containing protein [Hyphomicrobiales bacterium]|nr:META domain-containing protein [Hyphomicrobiales bacterium]